MFCRELLARFERARSSFHVAGVRAAAVAMCRPDEARAFCGRRAPTVTCLCDASKRAYTAYGLGRAGVLEVLGPEAAAAGIRATLSGHIQGRAVGDPMMMPGTFAIDQIGIVRAAHYARHAGDQPDLRAMLAALRTGGADPR